MMLFSVVNTKLRDEYASLDDGFEYNAQQNKFW